MRKNFLYRGMMLLASALTIASCTDNAEEFRPQGTRALDVQVAVNPTSRAQVIGTSLPEGAKIGVNVTAADGSEYDGQNAGYLNVAYTATGTGGTQTWGSTTPVMLSGTEGKLYAYYPHTADVDYKAIEVNIANQHDWMVGAEAYAVSDKAPSVAITMNHAQTALNINVVRDAAYTGEGLVEALAIISEGLASEGTLDTRDGSWSALSGANTAISIISAPFTLDGTTLTNQENPYMFVPASDETKDFTVSATVDGKAYNVGVAMNEAFAKGKVYKLNVNITNTGLTVSQVTLTDWVIDTTLPDAEFEPYDPLAKYADWVKLTYNVTVNSSATQIISEYADIASVAEMAILENDGSRAAGEPIAVTPAKTYQFSTTGAHTVYVKFKDITTIPKDAFNECTGLTEIIIPNSVQTIGEVAFRQCTGLTEVTIGSAVTTIGDMAFMGCAGLTEVTIGSAVTTIGDCAFEGCKGLINIVIPNSVQTIGEMAFSGCWGLTSVTIPNSVQTIGRSAFYGCEGLTSITIPNSVQTIGAYAFEGCTRLTGELVIPNSVTEIGEKAFYDCRGLTEITIPNSVQTIGHRAFYGCDGLTEVTIGEGVQTGICCPFEDFFGDNVKVVIILEGVTSIGEMAFQGCDGLTEVVIPNSVTSIGEYAFSRCTGLTEVTIPNSVQTIGNEAFYKCEGLTTITSLATTAPSIKSGTFDEVKSGGILYVPQGATGYDTWLSELSGWTIQEITE